MEAMRASFNGGSGDAGILTSGHQVVVKKANIVPDGNATVQHKSSKYSGKAPQVKKTVMV